MSSQALAAIVSQTPVLKKLHGEFEDKIFATPPYSLGFPSGVSQSSYYLGERISREEIALVSKALDAVSIFPENTRIEKLKPNVYNVLQASVDSTGDLQRVDVLDPSIEIHLV